MSTDLDAPQMAPAPRTSGMAIASLVLGIFSFLFWFFTGIPAIVLGIISLIRIGNSRGAVTGSGMAIAGIVLGGVTSVLMVPIMIALLLPAVSAAREAARAAQSMNNIKQIELGLLNYESVNSSLPAAGVDESGNGPQLSWRVHILPYLEDQPGLYDQFHLDEPWDSEHNRALIQRMPPVYKNPNLPDEGDGRTVYLAVTGAGAAFQGGETGPSIGDFRDGLSNTLLIVEADPDEAVIWTKPEDWQYDPQNPLRGLGNVRPGMIMVGMGDGSVHRLPNDIDSGEFTRMVTRDAGD